MKGIGKLQVHSGCKGYSSNTLLFGSSVVANTSRQITGDILSQIGLKHICCEELSVKVNFCQTPVEVAYKKAIAHLGDLRSASTIVSYLLEKVKEQEWKNHHIIYRNTHSVLLVLIVNVILFCLLFKVNTFTRRWISPCLYRKEARTTPTELSPAMLSENKNNTNNDSDISREGNLKVAKPTSPSHSKASHPRVTTSHF